MPIFVWEDSIAVSNFPYKAIDQEFQSNDDQILSVIIGEIAFVSENAKLHSEIEKHVKNLQEHTEKRTTVSHQLQQEIAEHQRAEGEKKKLEAQLQRAQRMEAIGTLAGGIAHDFNNVLTAIIGYTELLRYDLPADSKVEANLEAIFQAAIRAKDLVQQILTFSRQGEQEKKPLRISTIIKEALKLLRASLPTTIEIRQNLESNSDIILANPTQIHQVLINLCTNSAHAMREKGGVLKVSLEDVDVEAESVAQNPDLEPGPYVKLAVSDTGSGIAPEILNRIFDPYFSTREPDQGTGMGLAVVHGIVKGTGGTITVDSTLGEETTINVFFPRITSEVTPEARALIPFPSGNERILFVDDEKALVDIGAQLLEHLGYQVTARTSSIEALEAFRNQPEKFDLVMTDQTMPNMTGEMLAKELIRIKPDIPVVLCTGYSEIISEEKAAALGIKKLIMKPILMREISQTLRQILDQGDKNRP
jgi:signal transduction histidine kinase/ActR/RegA family two-component response regulator